MTDPWQAQREALGAFIRTQRKFAEEVVKATTSLMPGSGDSAADKK